MQRIRAELSFEFISSCNLDEPNEFSHLWGHTRGAVVWRVGGEDWFILKSTYGTAEISKTIGMEVHSADIWTFGNEL